jgi:hypothetical protein
MEQQMATGAAAHRHKHGRKPISQKVVTSIIDGLKQIYFHKVRVHIKLVRALPEHCRYIFQSDPVRALKACLKITHAALDGS